MYMLHTFNDSDHIWIPTTNCTHANDVGVRCQAFEDVFTPNDAFPTELTIKIETYYFRTETTITLPSKNRSIDETSATDSKTIAMKLLTALLTAALVVVTMGWIVSCVYWQRRIKQR